MAKYVRYNEVSLYRGSFPYILLLLGPGKSFVIPRTSLYRGSLNRGSTVLKSIRLTHQREQIGSFCEIGNFTSQIFSKSVDRSHLLQIVFLCVFSPSSIECEGKEFVETHSQSSVKILFLQVSPMPPQVICWMKERGNFSSKGDYYAPEADFGLRSFQQITCKCSVNAGKAVDKSLRMNTGVSGFLTACSITRNTVL